LRWRKAASTARGKLANPHPMPLDAARGVERILTGRTTRMDKQHLLTAGMAASKQVPRMPRPSRLPTIDPNWPTTYLERLAWLFGRGAPWRPGRMTAHRRSTVPTSTVVANPVDPRVRRFATEPPRRP
jgi:hypothetical protein